jgi:hypothetical protein
MATVLQSMLGHQQKQKIQTWYATPRPPTETRGSL